MKTQTKYPASTVYAFAQYYYANWNTGLNMSQLFERYQKEMRKIKKAPKTDEELKIISDIERAACRYLGVHISEVHSGRKYGDIPSVRQITCYIAKKKGFKEVEIAKALGMKRSMVYHRVSAAERYIETEKNYRYAVTVIMDEFCNEEISI